MSWIFVIGSCHQGSADDAVVLCKCFLLCALQEHAVKTFWFSADLTVAIQ